MYNREHECGEWTEAMKEHYVFSLSGSEIPAQYVVLFK